MNPLAWAKLGALTLAFMFGWEVNGWRHDAALKDAQVVNENLTSMLRQADDDHASALKDAQNETNRLRDRVSSGAVRLRVAACKLPEAASTPGVDSGAGAELDPAARSAYFALRDGIDRAEAQLAACQAELRLITSSP